MVLLIEHIQYSVHVPRFKSLVSFILCLPLSCEFLSVSNKDLFLIDKDLKK